MWPYSFTEFREMQLHIYKSNPKLTTQFTQMSLCYHRLEQSWCPAPLSGRWKLGRWPKPLLPLGNESAGCSAESVWAAWDGHNRLAVNWESTPLKLASLLKITIITIDITMLVLYPQAVSNPPVEDSQVGLSRKNYGCQIDFMVFPCNRNYFKVYFL